MGVNGSLFYKKPGVKQSLFTPGRYERFPKLLRFPQTQLSRHMGGRRYLVRKANLKAENDLQVH
jgi:hypothetical protein